LGSGAEQLAFSLIFNILLAPPQPSPPPKKRQKNLNEQIKEKKAGHFVGLLPSRMN